jgi:hypothetical protein
VVHHPVEAVGKAHRRDNRVVVALICAGALLGGCGGSSNSNDQRQPSDALNASAVGSVRSADCSDWKRGTVAQRRSTVVQLRKFAAGPVGSAEIKRGPVLDDRRAYKVLESYCIRRFARGFKLYKLYERAAAFVGH